ncbi:MAG: aldo/keto reductase [Anaerolineae bacterium]|nr:aldo/keto reductase [Chloroflexota bacterium]
MEQRRFGNTDLTTSAIGFGTWALGTTQYGEIDVQEASVAINQAIDAGITLIDTAEVYGPRYSEEIVGRALGKRRQEIVLVTKVGFLIDEDNVSHGRDSSRHTILTHAEGCLQRLQTDYVDLLLIHWPDHKTPFEEVIGALEELKAQGKIRHYGVSNYTVEMMQECARYGRLTANQVGYNLLDRRMEAAVLPYCQAEGIGYMAYGSLAFGLLAGAFTPETTFVDWDWRSRGVAFGLPLFEREAFLRTLRAVERLKALAAESGHSVAQLALAWVLGNPAVTVGLVGIRNPRELQENVAAADWKLSGAEREEIDRIFEEEGVPTHRDAPQAV